MNTGTEFGIHANDFFQTLGDFHQEGVVGEELVCRMASRWKKVVDKAALLTLVCKLTICGRSVSWWDEELRQLVRDCRACFAQVLDNDSNWNDYLRTRMELKQKIREKQKIFTERLMAKVNNNYRKNIKAF